MEFEYKRRRVHTEEGERDKHRFQSCGEKMVGSEINWPPWFQLNKKGHKAKHLPVKKVEHSKGEWEFEKLKGPILLPYI